MQTNPMQIIQQLMGNPTQLKNDFGQFKRNVTGNPQQQVMNMVRSGQISQQQLNAAQQIAPMLANLLGIKK